LPLPFDFLICCQKYIFYLAKSSILSPVVSPEFLSIMSEPQSEPQKETSQEKYGFLTPKFILAIGGVIALWILAITIAVKLDNFLCLLSICSSNPHATTPFAELVPVTAAGLTVLLMAGVFGMSILPALGLGAISFLIFQFIH